jgi:hypothetical protein
MSTRKKKETQAWATFKQGIWIGFIQKVIKSSR